MLPSLSPYLTPAKPEKFRRDGSKRFSRSLLVITPCGGTPDVVLLYGELLAEEQVDDRSEKR